MSPLFALVDARVLAAYSNKTDLYHTQLCEYFQSCILELVTTDPSGLSHRTQLAPKQHLLTEEVNIRKKCTNGLRVGENRLASMQLYNQSARFHPGG